MNMNGNVTRKNTEETDSYIFPQFRIEILFSNYEAVFHFHADYYEKPLSLSFATSNEYEIFIPLMENRVLTT